MVIYSPAIFTFIAKCEKYLKDILESEVNVSVRRTRFELGRYLYPIHIVIFTGEDKLGYFDPHTFQIGLSQNLMFTAKEKVLKDIIRHELAHYLSFIEFENITLPHGPEFRAICHKYGWDSCVSKASMNIEKANESIEGDLQSEKVIKRVKNLLKLAQSDNEHEAQLATMKANQLLLKHNIKNLEQDDDKNIICVKRVLSAKRRNAKLSSVYDILKHFLVKPVLLSGKGLTFIEVSGSKENIELADYIASFLDTELERLWNKAKMTGLKGQKAKNSFFMGMARGYDEKMQNLKSEMPSAEQNALLIIEKKMDIDVQKIYRRLASASSSAQMNADAFQSGKQSGKNLTINQALKNTKQKFLSWSR